MRTLASQRRVRITPFDQKVRQARFTARGSGIVVSIRIAIVADHSQKTSWNRNERR